MLLRFRSLRTFQNLISIPKDLSISDYWPFTIYHEFIELMTFGIPTSVISVESNAIV